MSIVKIARRAGVSTATVSRVINEHPYVSTQVVQAVNEAIASMNYQPRKSGPRKANAKSNEKGGRRKLAALAIVMPEVRAGFMPSLIKSFDTAASDFAHQVLVCNTDNSSTKQADVIVQLVQNHVAGVALMPTTVGPPAGHQIRLLQSAGVPVVLLHRGIEGVNAPLIEFPYKEVGRRLGCAVTAAGHRRVAVFFPHSSESTVDLYKRGISESLTECGVLMPKDWIHVGCIAGPTSEEHESGLEAVLDRFIDLPVAKRPTAIIATWEADAELLYVLLMARGLRVPNDVSIITVGSSWRGRALSRRLSAITIDEIEVGRVAAKLLIEMAANRKSYVPQQRHDISLGLHGGLTLGQAPNA